MPAALADWWPSAQGHYTWDTWDTWATWGTWGQRRHSTRPMLEKGVMVLGSISFNFKLINAASLRLGQGYTVEE